MWLKGGDEHLRVGYFTISCMTVVSSMCVASSFNIPKLANDAGRHVVFLSFHSSLNFSK